MFRKHLNNFLCEESIFRKHLNNFIWEELILMIFIRASISITWHDVIMTNQNTKEWERWNLIPICPIEATTICLVFLLIIANTTKSNKILLFCFIFSEYFTWLFNCYLWVRYPSLGTHYYFWQRGVLAVKSHQGFGTGEQFDFWV